MIASLRRAWIFIVVLGVVGAGAGLAWALVSPAKYTSSSDVFFAVGAGGSLNELSQGNQFIESRLRTYTAVVTSPLVLDPVIEELGLDVTSDELADQVQAVTQVDTVILTITATADTAEEAAALAAGVLDSLENVVPTLEDGETGPQVTMTVLRQPTVPQAPSAPHPLLFVALGGLIGLAGGAVVAVLRGRVDDTVTSPTDIAAALPDTALLGVLPKAERADGVTDAVIETRTMLLAALAGRERGAVLVTSTTRGEGRTATALLLAQSLAAMGKRVCLVDADLRHPDIAARTGLDGAEGLQTVLTGTATLAGVVRAVGPGELTVIPAAAVTNPAELLSSPEMDRTLRRLDVHWDAVIIDAPAIGEGPDATILAESVGVVVLVARTGSATRRGLARAVAKIRSVGGTTVGVVLTGARAGARL